MKISISIPVYNRKNQVEVLAESLENVEGISRHSIQIFDDCSTEFGMDYLHELFPSASIAQNIKNMGADRNAYQICTAFLNSDSDILFVCDSDLLIHPKALLFIEKNMSTTNGILSIYNSSMHPKKKNYNDQLIIKDTIGAAGSCFTKSMMNELIENIPKEQILMWDWAFCGYMQKIEKNIYVTKQSFVQHLGINGENSSFLLFDYGLNYDPITIFEKKEIAKIEKIFIENWYNTSDNTILKVLFRKKVRISLRGIIKILFGLSFLIKILSIRKHYRKTNNE